MGICPGGRRGAAGVAGDGPPVGSVGPVGPSGPGPAGPPAFLLGGDSLAAPFMLIAESQGSVALHSHRGG